MSHFEAVIGATLEHEGGFVNNKMDPGGATKWGISLRWLRKAEQLHPEILALLDDNDDGVLTIEDVEDIDPEEARALYRAYFWLPEYDGIARVELAGKVFDMGVNMGTNQAAKIAQRAARAHGITLVDDGAIGPRTLTAWNSIGAPFLPTLREAYAGFHRALTIRNNALIEAGAEVPDFDVFLPGWLNRDYS